MDSRWVGLMINNPRKGSMHGYWRSNTSVVGLIDCTSVHYTFMRTSISPFQGGFSVPHGLLFS